MKRIIVMGVVLIILGILAMACGGIPSAASEKGFRSGPLEPERAWKIIPFPPPLGGAALGGGVILIFLAVRTKP